MPPVVSCARSARSPPNASCEVGAMAHPDPESERIEIHVGALEIEGLDVKEPALFESAFAAELGRLVTSAGLPVRARALAPHAELLGGTLTDADVATPERLGQAVARQVYAELGK